LILWFCLGVVKGLFCNLSGNMLPIGCAGIDKSGNAALRFRPVTMCGLYVGYFDIKYDWSWFVLRGILRLHCSLCQCIRY